MASSLIIYSKEWKEEKKKKFEAWFQLQLLTICSVAMIRNLAMTLLRQMS